VYYVARVYVVKVMRSGVVLRISIPRELQRHATIRAGDMLCLEAQSDGSIKMWKLDPEALRSGKLPFPQA
jgi:bifunctional DNA-binding transcriptional regulator/antitoxin component of YhaV-PrlF toxin-antitoxin module